MSGKARERGAPDYYDSACHSSNIYADVAFEDRFVMRVQSLV